MSVIKYFTKDELVRVNNAAIAGKLNRSLEPGALRYLPRNLKYPVSFSMEHNDHIRVQVVLNEDGETGWIDMSWEDYDRLPEHVANKENDHAVA